MYKFVKDEKVLCFHGPLLYEAKVLKVDFWDPSTYGDAAGPHYFVHYKGWKNTWDEWVPEPRLVKLDDEGLAMQKELQATYGTGGQKSKAKSSTASTTQSETSKKRQREAATEREDEYLKKPEVRIPIPDGLKARLVDDWEYITKCQRLVTLPRTPTVSTLLELYRDSKIKARAKDAYHPRANDQLNEVIEGLKLYFDKALGTVLLYRFERQQYANVLRNNPGKRMCDVYGAEHLIRLFVQLPLLIVHTTMDKDTIAYLKDQINQIIIFIQKNSDKFFLEEYENAPAEYSNAVS